MTTENTATTPPPWHAAYPAPRNSPATISREEVLDMIKRSVETSTSDYVLVDLRRNDHEGGTIRTSINLPAQSLHPSIPTLYALFKSAGARKVIWYCGSSTGRGSRATAWFADYIEDQKDEEMKSLALAGGVKGWAKAGDEYVQQMIEYDASVWSKY
ncbi:Rhodanese-like protein [Aaosphaeria arxii CBS 175.79]|uniref:Rhodanese-like protein n=1 Tax=Aaosphaeria arxii CBS 175.79 TaxID=1450172 RepID=A0A6A5X9M9_9PLEO|nr:Rhodanese-like protein [Aaosphaeria arxii CBS 175.79]KAF2009477.1 Rhodanese-like protein [Aaosphaeria arxii CBS 175.79]